MIMRERDFWNFIQNKLSLGIDVALLIVAASSDATPGRKGFKMAVAADGSQSGTIGGGVMEFNLVKEVNRNFAEENRSAEIHRLRHSRDTDEEKSGLICGGRQTIIVKYLTNKDLSEVEKIGKNFSLNKNGVLKVSPEFFSYDENPDKLENQFILSDNNVWELREPLGFETTVYVVGSGHVGVAVCRQFSALGFRTVVFDHRDYIFEQIPNPYADERIVTSYKNVGDFITESDKSFIVIVSPQHTGDKDALGSVINKNVKYIGMMGSRKKIDLIFELLQKEGVKKELFEKVHAPIGLRILSESPEEIAVSIAAEVIEIKNKKRAPLEVKSF